jgi:hypothetical protein
MNHATRTIPGPARNAAGTKRASDSAAGVIILAAAMAAALTLFAGANLLGDRFDPSSTIGWTEPG